ncbi:MAG: hypothetical protein Q9216_002194 [Gyalolechia sp. 2 TL-2023]
MAFPYSTSVPWHEGEDLMHSELHVPQQENPTYPFLTPNAARLLLDAPLLALGTLDHIGRPWTTLLGGAAGFARPLDQSIIGIRTLVDPKYDPVISCLLCSRDEGNSVGSETESRPFSALSIDLATRSRVKLAGQTVAGALEKLGGVDMKDENNEGTEAQMVFKVERSLGNCPKYLNKKQTTPTVPDPAMLSNTLPLTEEATALLAIADLFFITSSCGELSMGTNHRGGPPGFVRILQNDRSGTTFVYPEYSGNRLYQTLGNLRMNPKAGIVIPDFASRTVLYITGTTDIVIGKAAAALLPRSSVAVQVHVQEARLVRNGLAFKGQPGEPSPYNPPVRFLAAERAGTDAQTVDDRLTYARLVERELLTPSIGRFRFSVTDRELAGRWKPGQYVALAFEDDLGAGYSHMRDDDPLSLNDDLIRTFTVSSSVHGKLPKDEFEITVRNVGKVTNFLFHQNVRAGLEISLKGFGGTFAVEQRDGEMTPIVAGGIGITPLLAQIPDLDLQHIKLFWSLNVKDIGLVMDTFERFPQLGGSTLLYVSGAADAAVRGQDVQTTPSLGALEQYGAQTFRRRMVGSDIQGQRGLSATWYICAGQALRQDLLTWLSDRHVVFEDFNY